MANTTDGVEVRLGADTAQATSGVSTASAAINASLNELKSSLSGLSTKSAETSAAIAGHTRAMSHGFTAMSENVKVRFGSVNSAFETFRSSLLGLGEAFAAFSIIRSSINEMLRFEDEVRTLEIVMGMGAEKATQMSIALKLAGSSSDAYAQMALRVTRILETQPQKFAALGVATRDASGALLPMDTILQNVYKRMQDFKAGADQNVVVTALIGRAAKGFADDMSRLGAAQVRATELQKKFGIEMGPDKQAQVEAYRLDVNSFKVAVGAVGDKIAENLMPQLMRLAEYFNDTGPSAANFIINKFKELITVIDNFTTAVQEGALLVPGYWDYMRDKAAEFTAELSILFSEGFGAMRAYAEKEDKRITADFLKMKRDVLGIEVDYNKRMAALWSDKPMFSGGSANLPKSGKKNAPDLTHLGSRGGSDQLAAWKDELEQKQEAEGYFHEFSKAQEAAFWEAKLALIKGKGKEEVKLYQEIHKLIFEARKAAAHEGLQTQLAMYRRELDAAKGNEAEQERIAAERTAYIGGLYKFEGKEYERAKDEELKITQDWAAKDKKIETDLANFKAKAQLDASKHNIEMTKLNADQDVAMRRKSAQQRLSLEADELDKEYQLDYAALANKWALAKGDLVKQAEIDNQLLKLWQNYETKKTQVSNAAELERKQYALQAVQETQNAFASFFASFADGTKTMKQRFQDLAKAIEQSLAKIAGDQLAKQLFGAGTSGGNFLSGIMNKIFGGGADPGGAAALTGASSALTGSAGLLSSAAAALTAAASAMSLGSMGSGMGGVMGVLGGMGGIGGFPMFAAGTPYVPNDMIAMVHQGEAIIPAAYNRPGVGAAVSVQNNFHFAGQVDSRTMDQVAARAYMAQISAARKLM